MPERKPREDSGCLSASKTALALLDKQSRDQIFYRPDTLSFDRKEVSEEERAKSWRITHEIGGRGCKIVRHPGQRVPLLDYDACRYTRDYRPKKPGDTELNNYCSETMKKGSAGSSGGSGPSGPPAASSYAGTIGKDVGTQARLRAKPPAVSGEVTREVGGKFFVTRSTTQRNHGDNLTNAPNFYMPPFKPVDNLNDKLPKQPDFWKSRYSVEHSLGGDPVAHEMATTRPTATALAAQRKRMRAASVPVPTEVKTFFRDLEQSLRSTGPLPGSLAALPVTLIGGGVGPADLHAL
eukprot:TRINITY_DN39329_c0_g1_i1.p1 TRINITY_DN39329_c0_g1~~TRINITY_DN39329_c0_g1_i1.p1  ORF type:complete len:294 (+),score=56.26 TRINITY_DN39329_c0_g1_i1:109-990(+)